MFPCDHSITGLEEIPKWFFDALYIAILKDIPKCSYMLSPLLD